MCFDVLRAAKGGRRDRGVTQEKEAVHAEGQSKVVQ